MHMSGTALGRRDFLESHKAKRQVHTVYTSTDSCPLIINRGKQKHREKT